MFFSFSPTAHFNPFDHSRRTHSCNEQHCFVASWAACVGSDIIRTSPFSPIPTSFYSMVVPLAAQETADACPPASSLRAVPVMKWWSLAQNISCNLHHRLPMPSHPQSAKLFDQLVDVSYNNNSWRSGRAMIMVLTIPWRRALQQAKSSSSRMQMHMRALREVSSSWRSEVPSPVCFLTGLGACAPWSAVYSDAAIRDLSSCRIVGV